MPKMIRLTLGKVHWTRSEDHYLYINTKHIGSMHVTESLGGEFNTCLTTRSNDSFFIKETPEQILQLIKEAE